MCFKMPKSKTNVTLLIIIITFCAVHSTENSTNLYYNGTHNTITKVEPEKELLHPRCIQGFARDPLGICRKIDTSEMTQNLSATISLNTESQTESAFQNNNKFKLNNSEDELLDRNLAFEESLLFAICRTGYGYDHNGICRKIVTSSESEEMKNLSGTDNYYQAEFKIEHTHQNTTMAYHQEAGRRTISKKRKKVIFVAPCLEGYSYDRYHICRKQLNSSESEEDD